MVVAKYYGSPLNVISSRAYTGMIPIDIWKVSMNDFDQYPMVIMEKHS